MRVTWHSFDLRSGRRGSPVKVRSNPTVSRVLNEATDATLEVIIQTDGRPEPEWESATAKGETMLVALDELDRPIWGGYVYRRVATQDNYVTVSLATLEAYLDRRFVNNDLTFTDADQVSSIAYTVLAESVIYGVSFVIDAPYSNWKRDRTYLIDEDKTYLSILTELAGVENGIEFTVDLEWADDSHLVLNRVIRVRNRVGTAYLGGVGTDAASPVAQFHLPGSVVDFQFVEDYSAENGANGVVAVSSGEGDSRPESSEYIANKVVVGFGGNMPLFESRFTPSTSITDVATLNSHARRELHETWDGLLEFELTVRTDSGPQLNVDWFLGDDISVVLTCPRFPERRDIDGVALPGFEATMRCIAWELDLDEGVVKPTVVDFNEIEAVAL